MASHNQVTVMVRPRTLAHVLLDLREARRDWSDAIDADDPDAEDRATETEIRIEQLRDEFASQFLTATGLTWKQIEEAISEAVL